MLRTTRIVGTTWSFSTRGDLPFILGGGGTAPCLKELCFSVIWSDKNMETGGRIN